MPKKRKTRKQKILTTQRSHMVPETKPSVVVSQKNEAVSQGMTFSLTASHDTKQSSPKITTARETVSIATQEYGYLGKDLMRTALLTGAIVFAELLIRFFYLH